MINDDQWLCWCSWWEPGGRGRVEEERGEVAENHYDYHNGDDYHIGDDYHDGDDYNDYHDGDQDMESQKGETNENSL